MTVTINGTTGYTGPIGAIGDLSTTGNTTLGDASGDTLTINGSTTTFTQGTANGVAYLNGSKVLTTGSALTFDGSQLDIPAGSAAAPSLSTPADPNTGIFFPAADTIAFAEGGVEAMRLDSSGNMGIGTTSPSYRCVVKQADEFKGLSIVSAYNTNEWGLLVDGSNSLRFSYNAGGANAGERMRIDSSGNLLVGTTSSTFKLNVTSSGGDVASFNAGAAGQLLRLSQSSANSVIFRMNNSSNNFWDTQVNTDNSITWDYNDAERARITSSGAFGVANSNPSYLVDVGSNSGTNAFFRAEGSFIVRKYSFNNNGTTAITLRLSILNNGLQFSNFFMDASAHYFNNGGSWQVFRYAFQFMNEGGTLRHNIRMPNYEYGGSTSGVFTVGNPPSWTYDGGGGWYFDFTVAGGFVSYITLTSQGPGIRNLTLSVV